MKTDSFTKTVLTVIAICLLVLVVKDLQIIPQAHANPITTKVTNEAALNYALIPVNEDGSINVRLTSTETWMLILKTLILMMNSVWM